jgi:CRP-like cAMP-binding protein
VLYEPGTVIEHIYFPIDGIISLLTVLDDKALETSLIGHEGMVGNSVALGVSKSSVRALVQGTGKALRLTTRRFLSEIRKSERLQRIVLRYSAQQTANISRNAACNRFHVVEARLARWLLMTADRVMATEFRLTHAFMADMLGVRRSGVSVACNALRKRGLIYYGHGHITILNRRGLEAASCSCYASMASAS